MSMLASMFPPERSAQTGPSPATFPARSAATEAAPAPSTVACSVRDEQDRAGDLSIGHRDDRVRRPSSTAAPLARVLDRDAVCDRVPGRLQAGERGTRRRLDADNRDLRSQLRERESDSRRQPAAADRNDEGLDLGSELLRKLEAERSLSREDERVFEGVDEGFPGLHPLLRRGDGIVEAGAGEHHVRAVALGRLDLRHRRVLRHEDRRTPASCRHATTGRGRRSR
jgi:hypothetical protein